MKISGVYQIINTITGDCYIGSSVDLKRRKQQHFCEYCWKHEPNKQLYKDMKQYGKNSFLFKPIWLCDPEELKKYEQIAIDKYNPKYNRYAVYGSVYGRLNKREYDKKRYKEKANKIRQQQKQYHNQQCLYENELLSLNTLSTRFSRQGIEHPTQEAKKYLIKLP